MKRPKVIMHNSVSLDGSLVGFQPDLGQHYGVSRHYSAEMMLTGSRTVVTGVEMYQKDKPPEEKSDFDRPDRGPGVPYWVVPDSRGITQGLLHLCRRSEFCRDVIVLVSEKTSPEFINYLEERHYDYFTCGEGQVDLGSAMSWLAERYGACTIMVDSGPELNAVLLKQGLIDEISLLLHPVVVGNSSDKTLSHLAGATLPIKLQLLESSQAGGGTVLLHYKVER